MTPADAALQELLLLAARRHMLTRAVLSKPRQAGEKKTVLTLRRVGQAERLQAERFLTDGKALHENLPPGPSPRLEELLTSHGQINLLTAAGDCELRRAERSGKATLLGGNRLRQALLGADAACACEPEGNDHRKNRILSGAEPFLRLLDVSDETGRVRDKKQAKFRQINRFLELIRDCLPALPATGALRICDLCCGKSYLSFAAYHYFANILGRQVHMTGVDRKPDVIARCAAAAAALGFDGLEFVCGDVAAYDAGGHVHLVLSLHACDTATDLVLRRAVDWGAEVILSTPCCHHELNHSLRCPPLSFVAEHSMLRQKLCDAATDALRLKYLESEGYAVCALELIDPEQTPKNIMLRGLRRPDADRNSPAARRARAEYLAARDFLTGGNGSVQLVLCPPVPAEQKPE